jgi:hypothetical protein
MERVPNLPDIIQLKTMLEIFLLALVLVGVQRSAKHGLDQLKIQRATVESRKQQLYQHIDALEDWCTDRKQEYHAWYKPYFNASLTIPSEDMRSFAPIKRDMEDCILKLIVYPDRPITELSLQELEQLSRDTPQRITEEWDILLNHHMAKYNLEWQEYQDIANKYANPDQTKQQLNQDLADQVTSVWGIGNLYSLPTEITQSIQDTQNTLSTDFRYIAMQDEGSVIAYQQATQVFVRNTQSILREVDNWKDSLENFEIWYNGGKQQPLPKLIHIQEEIRELIAELHTLNHTLARSQHNRKIIGRLTSAIAALRAHNPSNWRAAYDVYDNYASIISASNTIKKNLKTKIEDTTEFVDNYPHRLQVLDAQYQRLQTKKSKSKLHINKLLEYDRLIVGLPLSLDANSDLVTIKKTLTKLEHIVRYF